METNVSSSQNLTYPVMNPLLQRTSKDGLVVEPPCYDIREWIYTYFMILYVIYLCNSEYTVNMMNFQYLPS